MWHRLRFDQDKSDELDDQIKPNESDDKVKLYEPDESEDFSEKVKTDNKINDIMGIYILSEIDKFTSNLDPNMKYTNSSYLELYKLLQRIN